MNILIFVNHLLGIGHLKRISLLARAMATEHQVTLINGGTPQESVYEGLNCVQLPSLRAADESFSALLTDENTAPDEAYFTARQKLICDTVKRLQPNCLITEHFPFGRGKVKQDFNAFLDAGLSLSTRPLIAASVRDILVSSAKKPNFDALPYDLVFVHGDESLKNQWGFVKGPQLCFTGYIHESVSPVDDFKDKVIVVAGGRSVSQNFLTSLEEVANLSDDQFVIRAEAPDSPLSNCDYRPFIPNLTAGLGQAKLLISQAGYNIFVESQKANVPTLFIPFHTDSEDEQTRRLIATHADQWAEIVPSNMLTANILKTSMNKALLKPRHYSQLNFDGINTTLRILNEHLARH